MITASDMLKLSKDCAEYKVNTVYEDSNVLYENYIINN